MKNNVVFLLILAFFCAVSCEKIPLIRHYKEVVVEPSLQDPHAGLDISSIKPLSMEMPQNSPLNEQIQSSVGRVFLKWKTPSHWQEEPGSGMRLATFRATDKYPIICTIVSLGGMAGGLEENIKRWMGQINLEVPEKQLTIFINSIPTKTNPAGISYQLIDLNQLLQKSDGLKDSTLAAILSADGATVFIKMTGTVAAIDNHQSNFIELIESLKANNE